MKFINIIDYVLKEEYWNYERDQKHLSGHCYYRSPYETDDSCGNCNGARCDYCREIIDKKHMEFVICTDVLEEIMRKANVPENVIYKYFSYEDGNRAISKLGYSLIWPTEDILKDKHPEFYDKLYKVDEDILKVIKEFDDGSTRAYAEIRSKVRKKLTGTERVTDNHLEHQLELYWVDIFEPRVFGDK